MATHSNSSSRSKTSQMILWITVNAITAALLVASKEALSWLTNVEVVSILVICFSVVFGWKILPSIYIFVLAELLLYSPHLWTLMYLYVWTVLAIVAILLRRFKNPFLWCFICGFFGFAFGFFCAIPYFFIGGWTAGISYWLAGLSFDVPHGIFNFVTGFLFVPLTAVLRKCKRKMRI